MMTISLPKFGLGIDIEDISRFRKKPYLSHQHFYKKIFSVNEIQYCLAAKDPYPHFAARFCAKEAFIKAFPQKITGYPEIEIVNASNKPFVLYQGIQYTVSLSHESDKAVAVVII